MYRAFRGAVEMFVTTTPNYDKDELVAGVSARIWMEFVEYIQDCRRLCSQERLHGDDLPYCI